MTKKSKKYYIITSVFIFVIFFISSNVFASNYQAYGQQLANELFASGEYDFIADTVLNKGILSTIEADVEVVGFQYNNTVFSDINLLIQNVKKLVNGPLGKKNGKEEYNQSVKDLAQLYVEITTKIRKSDNELANCALKSMSKGTSFSTGDSYFIAYVITELIWKYCEDIKSNWDKAKCSDNGGSFKYNGKEYSCSTLTYSEKNTGYSNTAKGGYAYFAGGKNSKKIIRGITEQEAYSVLAISLSAYSVGRIEMNDGVVNCVDKQEEKKKQQPTTPVYNYSETASATENEKTTVEIIELNTIDNFNFSYDLTTGKKPSLINAIKYSTEASKAGELVLNVKGSEVNFSSQFSESLIEPLIDIVLQYGKYIVYAALLFFGVRAIFNGARGKSDFKTILPYLLIALVFFYSGRGIVDMIKETYEQSVAIGGETYDQNAYNEFLSRIFSTVVYIVRILAFAGIIFAGLKYMFTSPSEKAQIKKTMLAIVIGCIFVFSSTFVVNLVVDSLNEAGLKNDIEITDGS